MFSDQKPGRLFHSGNIQWIIDQCFITTFFRGHHASVPDPVKVCLLFSLKSRMKIRISFKYPENADILRKVRIECQFKFICGDRMHKVHRRDLSLSMYAGICPSGTHEIDFLMKQSFDRIFYLLLDRWSILLFLPSGIGSSVISNDHSDSSHEKIPVIICQVCVTEGRKRAIYSPTQAATTTAFAT